ncbi:hypothetical protein FOA43_002288 [Brettanomyces nanus]|uniref:Uncharacterized protein n=1 Tax=Eeniella nana TaxID=13502 RepID=A0A875S5B2_EENNA|nr:uncharacterized protein FOA43_002288 [Brettanomyces nanus]QPG74949.1 hypothetical protein FOA43_002288 [Brettanomyces nanus]
MPRIATDNLTVNNLGLFNEITAPKQYSDNFITNCHELDDLCQYAFFEEVPVGLVVSRYLQAANSTSPKGLIVVILRVLSAYSKRFGLEDALFDYVEKLAVQKKHLNTVYLLADPTADQWLVEDAKKRGYEEDQETKPEVDGKLLDDVEGKVLLKRVMK